jgi:hypothetical protein
MAIPSSIESLSTTAASNGPAGTDDRSVADDGLRQAYAFIRQGVTLGSNIASASSITPLSTGSVFNITGTTAITGIASTNSWDGRVVTFIFAGALTLTHGANLALPGSVNITTAANDVATFVQTGSGAWRCNTYQKAGSGALLAGNVVIAAPSSGATLAISSPAATTGYAISALGSAGAAAREIAIFGHLGVSNGLIISSSGVAGGMSYNFAGGNATFAAPGGGNTLAASGFSGATVFTATVPGASVSYGYQAFNGTAQYSQFFDGSNNVYAGTSTNHPLITRTNNTDRHTISNTGNHTFAAPSGGVGLTTTGFAGSDTAIFNGGTSGSFRVTDRGLPYGTSIHNNAGAVTGTTSQYITSGTYTPTLTAVTNIASSTSDVSQWTRVGNVVTVSGVITAAATAAAGSFTELGVSLPIASAMTLTTQLGGAGQVQTFGYSVGCYADATNDRASLQWISNSTASNLTAFMFTYVIV